jgi:hypothetical protein
MRGLVIFNTVTLALMLLANYAANAGAISELTVGEVSDRYDSLFTPAGYAFSIWGVIFFLGICFVLHQWRLLGKGDKKNFIERTGIWFAVSNIANILWLYCWINQLIGLSVLLIFVLLVSLCILTIHLRLELDDEPVQAIFFVWWPISVYLGWLMVAAIANVAAWLVFLDIDKYLMAEVSAITMIIIATLLYLILIKKRNMREAAVAGIWAFLAIAYRRWEDYRNIATTAIIASVILLIAVGIHAFRQRKFNPIAKLARDKWK